MFFLFIFLEFLVFQPIFLFNWFVEQLNRILIVFLKDKGLGQLILHVGSQKSTGLQLIEEFLYFMQSQWNVLDGLLNTLIWQIGLT